MPPSGQPARHPTLTQSFSHRASLPNTHPLAAYLLNLITIKQSNLCVSADVSSSAVLLQLAEDVGDSICMLKTHADIVDDWSERTVQRLKEISRQKGFLLFEDRKFGDIGSTTAHDLPYDYRNTRRKLMRKPRHRPETIYVRPPPHRDLGRHRKRPHLPGPLHHHRPPRSRRGYTDVPQPIRLHRNQRRHPPIII